MASRRAVPSIVAQSRRQSEEDTVVSPKALAAHEAPTFLNTALHRNWAYHVFKHLTPHDAGRLEQCLASATVFTEPAVTPLLRMVAGRMQAAAEKEGATMLVPLDEGREGRITWAKELLWIFMAMARLRVQGAKKMISGGDIHSLVTSGKAGEIWSFGDDMYGSLGHGGDGNEAVPRLIEALNHVVDAGGGGGVSFDGADAWWGRLHVGLGAFRAARPRQH